MIDWVMLFVCFVAGAFSGYVLKLYFDEQRDRG